MQRNEKQAYVSACNLCYEGLWVVGGDGRVIMINPSAERLCGIRAADVVGMHVSELVESGVIDISVSEEVLKYKRPVNHLQLAKKSGKHILVTATPELDDDGNVRLVVISERDVTELADLHDQIAEAKRFKAKYEDELVSINAMISSERPMVADSHSMQKVLRTALRLARLNVSNILILGESGTGKGLLSRIIHDNSVRRERPLVQINSAALPESLLEAELFGYEAGAYTGARQEGKAGLLELAEGGTLFLDEIGDMPLSIQSKLLKYLDDKEVRRIGSTQGRVVNCAVIAATNSDLESLVEEKRFRKDLYFRLNAFPLKIPALRERSADIVSLVALFLKRYNQQYGKHGRFSLRALEALQHYHFPGNVRELDSLVKNAVVMCDTLLLDEAISARIGLTEPSREEADSAEFASCMSLTTAVRAYERELIMRAMKHARTTRELASRLGISQATVVRRLKHHGLSGEMARLSGSRTHRDKT